MTSGTPAPAAAVEAARPFPGPAAAVRGTALPSTRLFGWDSPAATAAHAYLEPAIVELLPGRPALRILDAGCGNGYLAGRLAERGHEVVGVDASEDGVAVARRAHPLVRFEQRSVYDELSDVVAGADVVIATEVIEHLYSPRAFVRNLYRALRPGGSLILSTPYHGYAKNLALSLCNAWDRHHTVDWEGGHIKFYSPRTLRHLLQGCGFTGARFRNAGRLPWLWKSMVCRAERPAANGPLSDRRGES